MSRTVEASVATVDAAIQVHDHYRLMRVYWKYLIACVLMFVPAAWADNVAAITLLNGQTLRGSISDPLLTIRTRWGDLQVEAADIESLICQPPPHVWQAIDTQNGDTLVGRVTATSIHLLTDGKTVELALSQISRIAEAARPAKSDPTDAAILVGLGGDRLAVNAPASVAFRSRWGLLTLQENQVHQIIFSDKTQAVHRIVLNDGSRMSGILATDSLTLTPRYLAGAALTIPVGEMAKLTFNGNPPPRTPGAELDLIGGDVLRGSMQGSITLQTAYGELSVAAETIQKLAAAADASGDWSMTLNDGRIVGGAPTQATVACQLDCGVQLTLPTALISSYSK
jgi:hypothetical protein